MLETETPQDDTEFTGRAKSYNRQKFALSMLHFALISIFIIFLVLSGLTVKIEDIAFDLQPNPYIALLIFTFIIGIIQAILFKPLELFRLYFGAPLQVVTSIAV